MLGLRKLYIKETENKLLDQGYDCYLSLLGKKQNELQIKFILMSRPVVHKMSKDPDFISTISKIGFTKVHFTDGFNDSWTLPIAQQPTISNKVRTLPKN